MSAATEISTWTFDALEALRRWPGDRRLLMLHSGRVHEPWARYSILAEADGAWRFETRGEGRGVSAWLAGEARDRAQPSPAPPAGTGAAASWRHRPFADLRAVLEQGGADAPLWLGYFGYDIARFIEPVATSASRARADRDWPIVQLERCPGWLVYDGLEQRWWACGAWADGGGYPALDRLSARLGDFEAGEPTSVMTRGAYEAMVGKAKGYIAAGDVFQVNLGQRMTADFAGDRRRLYEALATASPAWYGAYLELTPGGLDAPGRVVCSTSPELFLDVDAAGRVVTRPMKGTSPASADPAALERSEKDAAELHMIVDLLRNDLGRVCRYGSVRVEQPRTIESHPTVHQGVATVTGELHASKSVVDLLRATLPGGSITGAPKVRAMQIIDELEPVRRGLWCGAIGWLRGGGGVGPGPGAGGACLNIAIRTLLVETDATGHGRVDFSVGGGIVADSQPAAEYQESLDKAQAMLQALRRG
ncbi:MAG: anthranilate synthase component I family protein [Phycisphaeraceae bacterium]